MLTIFDTIRKEFSVNDKGESFCSRRAIARMSGKRLSTIQNLLQTIADRKLPHKMFKPFEGVSFEGDSGVNLVLAKAIVRYYYSKGCMTLEGCEFAGLPYTKKDEKKKNSNPERKIQLKLSKILSGEKEVPCKSGFVDILTDSEIIEVKKISMWKSAIGQVLVYQLEFPNHQARIHLFGECSEEMKLMIISYSAKLNVIATFES